MCVCVIPLLLYYSRPSLRLLLFFTGASFQLTAAHQRWSSLSLSHSDSHTLQKQKNNTQIISDIMTLANTVTRFYDANIRFLSEAVMKRGRNGAIHFKRLYSCWNSLIKVDGCLGHRREGDTPPTPSLPPITLAAEPNFRPALFLFLSLCFSVSLLLFSVYLPSSGLTNSVPTRINQTTIVKFHQLHRNIIDIDKKKTKEKKIPKKKQKQKTKSQTEH